MIPFTKGLLFGGILSVFCVAMAHCDTPTLHRHIEPPTPTISCTDELHQIRKRLVEASIGESLLWESYHNRKMADFFLIRSHVAQHTKDLDVSYANCTPQNLKELRIMAAEWEFMYLDDMEKLSEASGKYRENQRK